MRFLAPALALVMSLPALADPPASAPSPAPATATPKFEAIFDELQPLLAQVQDLVQGGVITDPQKRATDGATCIALIRRANALAMQLKSIRPQTSRLADDIIARHRAILAALNDAETLDQLQHDALSPDSKLSLASSATWLQARWLASLPEDEATRDQILDELDALARPNPASEQLADLVLQMSRGRVKTSQYNRLQAILRDSLKETPASAAVRKRNENAQKLAAIEGKPLTIRGVRADGSAFSTADWKGKVILVDFWATWCAPCVAELPRIQQAYAKHHDKGLEVIGVSCDNKAADLSAFLVKRPEMSWPQLFDASRPGWHALATEYGVDSLPMMFLIDRNGVCRSVHANDDFEQQIPKLLAE
jgi:thiol-disulfide isomerase/thioredoxin